MASHSFVFHSEDDLRTRPSFYPQGDIVVAQSPLDKQDYPTQMKFDAKADVIHRIRRRSACIDNSISRAPSAPTHIWPDPERGLTSSNLRFVITRCLANRTPDEQGINRLQGLSEVCCVIWALKCKRDSFYEVAKSILRGWEQSPLQEASDVDEGRVAKWLTIIAFVLGAEVCELEKHVVDLVWNLNEALKCPMEELQAFVNSERQLALERIYTLFQKQSYDLHRSHPNSEPIARVDSRLDQNNDSGISVDLSQGWCYFRDSDSGRKVRKMSPEIFYKDVLEIFQGEEKNDNGRNGGHRKSTSTSNRAAFNVSGQRTGKGGDLMKLLRGLFRSQRPEDNGAKALLRVVEKAAEEKDKWRDRTTEGIELLIRRRNDEQRKWDAQLPRQNHMNGSASTPSSAQ